MKRTITIVVSIIIMSLIVSLPIMFIVKPGIDQIKSSNSIAYLSTEEINDRKDEISKWYLTSSEELDAKYLQLQQELDTKYNDLENEIREKYEKLIKELESKYTIPMGQDGWFEQQKELGSKRSELTVREGNEISNNNQLKFQEKNDLSRKKSIEKNNLSDQKQQKLERLTVDNGLKESKKSKGVMLIVIGAVIILVIILIIIYMFNKLIKLRNNVKERWAQIDVVLKRRASLIPNIVETVKGYTKHENETLNNITKARSDVIGAKTMTDEIKANDNLSHNITKLLALEEQYPELKANQNYLRLQDELSETEDVIAQMRINYNKSVLRYKNNLQTFPSNLVGIICNFKNEEYYEITEKDRENVKIKI